MKDNKALETTEQIFKILIDGNCKDEDFKRKLKVSLPNIIARETKLRHQLEQALTKEVSKDTNVEDVEEPTKSAKEMFEELGYELVKDRSFPNLVSYVKKTECYERIEICFNVPSKTYSKELNDKVWAITNEEHQAITQQLKELEG